MGSLEVVRMALGSLAANRGRSFLTVLSITIGAFAIVVMSSLAESGLVTLDRGIEELGGARIMLVAQKTPERGEAKATAYRKGLTIHDRDVLFEGVPHVRAVSILGRLGRKEVLAESGLRASTSVVAADARFFDAFKMRIDRGRLFTEEENLGRSPVCIVGHKLAEKIGPARTEPLGRFLTVGLLRCRIIGVFADNERFGVGFGFDWTNLVVVPSETMGDLEPRVLERAMLFVQTDAPSSNEIVKRLLNARLSARHPGVDDFTLYDFAGSMEKFGFIFAAMEMIVALLAGIALFVGGVGVMNMMLVAVSERVREIGIRKALGARPQVIARQFLTEAVLLSSLGGGVGVVTGLGVAIGASLLIARSITTWQMSLAPWSVAAALVVSFVIGVGFGWLPAKQAARLDPVEAIRR
jgi:putative ABC transport system permease protein